METTIWGAYERGTFACVGSDNELHSVVARVDARGELTLNLDGGETVYRIVKGRYVVVLNGKKVRLDCDHPDAP
jgi:hypothetical protein